MGAGHPPQARGSDRDALALNTTMGQILIGACSWTDKSLIQCGRFYASWIRTPEDRLRFYAANFSTVEVDSSFYALPSRRNSELWVQRTPEDFVFHIKAFALFTGHAAEVRALPREFQDVLLEARVEKHRVYMKDLSADLQEEVWKRFTEALLPLAEAGKLGVVLFQYPPWFNPSSENRQYILECRDRFTQILPCQLAVEFRNSNWLNERNQEHTLGFLHDRGLAFVSVDEPQGFPSSVPPIATATPEVAYVRFHGRNRDTWGKRVSVASERFNCYYSDEELKEWVPKLKTLQEVTSTTHILFNTNYQDEGVVNARKLSKLLRET